MLDGASAAVVCMANDNDESNIALNSISLCRVLVSEGKNGLRFKMKIIKLKIRILKKLETKQLLITALMLKRKPCIKKFIIIINIKTVLKVYE